METMIRAAVQGDLSRISEIYAHHVLHGSASFELEPPSPEEISQRWEAVVSQGFPYLVVCRDEHVLGYAYANHFRTRPAYRFSLENSIYLDPEMRGKGLGTRLLQALIVVRALTIFTSAAKSAITHRAPLVATDLLDEIPRQLAIDPTR